MSQTTWIPYGRQSITEEDIAAVVQALKSDWLTTGPYVKKFEQKIAEYCQARYAVAFCNATAALHMACRALDVSEGDVVWTSPNTFVASANCALYCGATIDFVDIDEETYNLSVELLEEKLIQAAKSNCLPKVIIPVHFAGQSCDMRAIYALSQKYGFKIIEDASHAIGGRYQGRPIGNCQYSDIAVFSFHPVKVMTTGEGGMVLTNDPILADRLSLLRGHGILREPEKMSEEPHGRWYYEQVDLGMNYRITDFQCALGISQLNQLDCFVEKRNVLAENYKQLLSNLPVKLPTVRYDNYSAYHLYPIQITQEPRIKRRRAVFDYLQQHQIGVQVHYIPVHLQPYYQKKFGFKVGDFPKAEEYYQGALSLPLYADLTREQQNYVVEKLLEAVM